MDLRDLRDEYAAVGIGASLYHLILQTVRALVLSGRYPVSYSPTGQWDEHAFTGLGHDWAAQKLLRRGQLSHLLLTNETLGGFRAGLVCSFRDFLVGQRQHTVLDNLFRRAHTILEEDSRFRCGVRARKKAASIWGLASWSDLPVFQGAESELIAAAFSIADVPVIRYRDDARKLSPIVSNQALADFIAALFDVVGAPLSLAQLATVFRYRFNLLEAEEVSLDATEPSPADGQIPPLAERLPGGELTEDLVLLEETTAEILREMSPRQQHVLLAYAQPTATLESVARELGCSRGTVDNERHRVLALVRDHTESPEEAEAVYRHLLEALSSTQEIGNAP
jgi:hypothetical protein